MKIFLQNVLKFMACPYCNVCPFLQGQPEYFRKISLRRFIIALSWWIILEANKQRKFAGYVRSLSSSQYVLGPSFGILIVGLFCR